MPPGAVWSAWSKLAYTVKCVSLGVRIAQLRLGPVRRRRLPNEKGGPVIPRPSLRGNSWCGLVLESQTTRGCSS